MLENPVPFYDSVWTSGEKICPLHQRFLENFALNVFSDGGSTYPEEIRAFLVQPFVFDLERGYNWLHIHDLNIYLIHFRIQRLACPFSHSTHVSV
jgi:hypothetical protein